MNFSRKTIFGVLFIAFQLCMAGVAEAQVAEPDDIKAKEPVEGWVKMTREEYIVKWRGLAIDNMEVYGIPASITMGQAILESGFGNGYLARVANNHFCIKCKSSWTGPTITHEDDNPDDCFRVYDSVEESFRDHAEFLCNGSRYDFLFAYDITDYKSWAKGLKKAGYATASDYAERLIRVIENSRLDLLDQENGLALHDKFMAEELGIVVGPVVEQIDTDSTSNQSAIEPSDEVITPRDMTTAYADRGIDPNNFRVTINAHGGYNVYMTNGSHYVIAREGDSYEKLGKLFEVSASTLRRFNDREAKTQPAAGDIVYIDRKSARWGGANMVHVVAKGEDMYMLSQIYGIRMDQLAKMNRIRPTSPLVEGQTIKLR